MLQGVAYASVFVSDQDRALDFYTNVLGFDPGFDNPTPDGPRFLTVGVKGQDFQLFLWPGTPGQAQPVEGRIPGAYTIDTGDCREAVELLKSAARRSRRTCSSFPGAISPCSGIPTATGCSCGRC